MRLLCNLPFQQPAYGPDILLPTDLKTSAFGSSELLHWLRLMSVSAPPLHIESTDSMISFSITGNICLSVKVKQILSAWCVVYAHYGHQAVIEKLIIESVDSMISFSITGNICLSVKVKQILSAWWP